MLREALKKYADPSDEQKLRFKKPLWLRITGAWSFLLCLAITAAGINVVLIDGLIRQQQHDPVAWFLAIGFFILPPALLAWACSILLGPEDTVLDFSTRTYTIRRGVFLFPDTISGSFDDIQNVWLTNSSGTNNRSSGTNNRVHLVWKPKRRESTLDIFADYPTASEFGSQLADQLGVAFRENQPFGTSG